MAKNTVSLEGEEEFYRKLSPSLVGPPLRHAFKKWGIRTMSDAREGTPVNDGRLRSSVVEEVDDSGIIPEFARVGTNARTGPFIEGGTGTQSDLPGGSRKKHWPPPQALDDWARKHGVIGGGRSVAFFIGRRGGLKPRRFLRNAFEQNESSVPRLLAEAAREIERRAESM